MNLLFKIILLSFSMCYYLLCIFFLNFTFKLHFIFTPLLPFKRLYLGKSVPDSPSGLLAEGIPLSWQSPS